MKMSTKIPFIHSVLTTVLGLMLAGRVTAQTFTNLHNFSSGDGVNPHAGLVLSGDILYGTAYAGGSAGLGTVFAVNTDGTGFTNLHNFDGDGSLPACTLVLSGNRLYGTARDGDTGPEHKGTVFALNIDGTGFTNLYSFTGGSDGAYPNAGLVLSGNTLYGTADGGGSNGVGTVFKINTDGTDFTVVYSFIGPTYSSSDGAYPLAALIVSDNTLYGTTGGGGILGLGVVFRVNTDGTGFTNLHSFTGMNGEGGLPQAQLLLLSNRLYGTTLTEGGSGAGTVFSINVDGTAFTTLHSFSGGSNGTLPDAALILSGNSLFGTTFRGGSAGNGTVFKISTDGTGFATIYGFTASSTNAAGIYTNSDGGLPSEGLVLSKNTLYGMASYGGSSNSGTVFSIFIQPQLTIIPAAANVILTWPTNYVGFNLQSTTTLVAPIWTTNSPAPVVVNGQNTVTNPISGTQQFFRLSQ